MARRGENIRKRKDGRWEGRYIKARTSEGKIQWGYVYAAVRQPAAVVAPINGRNKNGTCFHNISIDIPLETDEQQTVIAPVSYTHLRAHET